MVDNKYLIEETSYNGWMVYTRRARGFGSPTVLVRMPKTRNNPELRVRGFMSIFDLQHSFHVNDTCHFESKQEARKALILARSIEE